MNNIEVWMVEHKLAKNEFAAHHIFAGLDLAHEPRWWKRVHRILLYRRWRDSKAFRDTASCYAKAIDGERVPELNLTT